MMNFLAAVGLGTIVLISLPIGFYLLGYIIGVIDDINHRG